MSRAREAGGRMGHPRCSVSADAPARGRASSALWWILWLGWDLLLSQQVLDAGRFGSSWQLIVLRCAPLLVFLWGWWRDSLTGLIWFELVLLFYFVSAVEAAFAYRADLLSVVGLALIILLFSAVVMYIRLRGRELRASV